MFSKLILFISLCALTTSTTSTGIYTSTTTSSSGINASTTTSSLGASSARPQTQANICLPSQHMTVANLDCSKFYYCFQGQTILLTCPNGKKLIFYLENQKKI